MRRHASGNSPDAWHPLPEQGAIRAASATRHAVLANPELLSKTLTDAVQEFIANRNAEERTKKSYRSFLNIFIEAFDSTAKLKELTKDGIRHSAAKLKHCHRRYLGRNQYRL
jgi:hypothetical protein